jgi:hypothetical protein
MSIFCVCVAFWGVWSFQTGYFTCDIGLELGEGTRECLRISIPLSQSFTKTFTLHHQYPSQSSQHTHLHSLSTHCRYSSQVNQMNSSNIYVCITHLLLFQHRPHTTHLILLLQDIRQRPNRRDLELVDLAMALGVVILDVFELCGGAESRVVPVQVAEPFVEGGIS